MPSAGSCAEIVRIRPKEGAETKLLEIRDALVQSFRDIYPGFVGCTLVRPEEGGTWVDLWYWETRAIAEEALAKAGERNPLFVEWSELVEMVEFEWAEVLSEG
jgi:hypothetical protein